MAEGDFKVQLSLKDGADMLNLRTDSIREMVEVLTDATLSEAPQLRRFFIERQGASGNAPSDVEQAAAAVAQSTGGKVLPFNKGPQAPVCPSCGGSMTLKDVTLKSGQTVSGVAECNQDRGECLNDKGFATSVWPPKKGKGRDS
jgi:hypothetical protein